MKVAVTGATGFIGRHVLKNLAEREVEAIALCRNPDAIETPRSEKLKIIPLDISDPNVNFSSIGEPDVLLHLAWGGLPNYMSLHHIDTELPQQVRFLFNLVKTGLKHLVVVGTCLEYGKQSGPLVESLETRPDSCYGYAKDSLRKQLDFLKHEYDLSLTWARLFYLYGEGKGAKSLYTMLRDAVGNGDKTFPMSGGEQLRDFLPVETAVKKLVDLTLFHPDCGPVNICSGEPISVRGLVENWLRENSWEIELKLGQYPYPEYEPMAFWGSKEKLDRVLEALAGGGV